MATIEPSPERWPELAALVDELAAVRAEIAALHAREAIAYARALELVLSRVEERRLLEPDRPDSDLVVRSVSAEIGAALRISDRSVQRRFG
ncbi:MAG: HNH endonuclease, partial [Microbacterium sp.]|nr:HNH endonuclease [Microbacterium sp.]